MADPEYKLFVRRYGKRIQDAGSYDFSLAYGYNLYKKMGENHFLTELEDVEEYSEFCKKYYSGLRELYNICSAGMWDYYQMYKVKFGGDEGAFRNELRLRIKNFDWYF